MTSTEIIKKVKELDLPLGQYVVFGSGPMAVHDIRETRDVDLFVTPTLYQHLKNGRGWLEKEWDSGGQYLSKDIYEADDSWDYGEYNPSPEEIIAIAEVFQGVPFAPLAEVLKWKKAFGREKDKADVDLLERYLKQNSWIRLVLLEL